MGIQSPSSVKLLDVVVRGWPSKIEHLVGAVDWLSASKPLVMKVKVGGSE